MVIHGGGNLVTKWMARQGLRPKFSKGLRVTDNVSLEIVVAVLTGLINKTININNICKNIILNFKLWK